MNEWHKHILAQSTRIAEARFHTLVSPEHLLLSLLDDVDAKRSINEVVNDRDMDPAALRNMLVKHLDHDIHLHEYGQRDAAPEIAESVEDLLYRAEKRSIGFEFDNMMAPDRKNLPAAVGVLLEILHRDDTYAAQCLKSVGVKEDDLMNYIEQGPKVLRNPKIQPPKPPKFS